MSAVLYDIPGPRAKARHRLYGIAGAAAILALLAWAAVRLWEEEQITPEAWRFLSEPSIVMSLVEGLGATLSAAVIAILLAVVFGSAFATARRSDYAVVSVPAVAVIEFFRAVPVLLMILMLYFTFGSTLGTYWSLVTALVLYNGSVLAEIFRAGIVAVPTGQVEAARALGLRKGQVLRLIQAPQAVSTMLPAIISQCVIALKDTALGYAIGAPEITRAGKQIFTSFLYNNPIAVGLVLMAVFVAINYSLSRLAVFAESRMRRKGGTVVRNEEDVAGA